MNVPNLRSPYAKVGGLSYFARMLDKIRLHAAHQLPAEYQPNLGGGFDGRALSFLWIEYPALVERVKAGGTDDEILEWACAQGRRRCSTHQSPRRQAGRPARSVHRQAAAAVRSAGTSLTLTWHRPGVAALNRYLCGI